jgi:hypothetical protein
MIPSKAGMLIGSRSAVCCLARVPRDYETSSIEHMAYRSSPPEANSNMAIDNDAGIECYFYMIHATLHDNFLAKFTLLVHVYAIIMEEPDRRLLVVVKIVNASCQQ